MSKITSELGLMSNREVVSLWNVMQFLRRTLNGSQHENEPMVSAELGRRGIPHQVGKRTVVK